METQQGSQLLPTRCVEQISRLFVQYIEGNPYAFAYLGASLVTHQGCHVLTGFEGDGLAAKANLRNGDVILRINGAPIENVRHLSVIDGLRHLGPKVAFVIRRVSKEYGERRGYFYFRLGSKDGIPVIESEQHDWETDGILPRPVLDFVDAYDLSASYQFFEARKIQLKLHSDDFSLGISGKSASFQPTISTLYMYKYRSTRENLLDDGGVVVALATAPGRRDDDFDSESDCDWMEGISARGGQLCIAGDRRGLLRVQTFPAYMRGSKPILVNNMFFALKRSGDGTHYIESIQTIGLYLSYDSNSANRASLVTTNDTPLDVNEVGKVEDVDQEEEDLITRAPPPTHRKKSERDSRDGGSDSGMTVLYTLAVLLVIPLIYFGLKSTL